MAVYGYMRVSSAGQIENTSLAEQRRKILAVAAFHDWVLEDIYEDKAVSGRVPLHERSGGYRLLAGLKAGDVVIASKLDRMFRSAEDALHRVTKLGELGVQLILADFGTDPVGEGATGRLFLTVLAAMAEFERSRISERTFAGRDAKRAQGGYVGGRPSYGYKVVGKGRGAILVPDDEKFKARAEVLAQRRRGLSYRQIQKKVQAKYPVKISVKAIMGIIQTAGLEELKRVKQNKALPK